MNARTRGLSRVIGARAGADGVVDLYKFIGRYNVKNSCELDVYINVEDFSLAKK